MTLDTKILLSELGPAVSITINGDRLSCIKFVPGSPKIDNYGSCPDLTKRVLDALDEGDGTSIPILYTEGTEFQKEVWNALREIPFGQTISYSKLASNINKKSAIRAVANACGANPIAVIIPCHRVIRSDGSLGGYRGVRH